VESACKDVAERTKGYLPRMEVGVSKVHAVGSQSSRRRNWTRWLFDRVLFRGRRDDELMCHIGIGAAPNEVYDDLRVCLYSRDTKKNRNARFQKICCGHFADTGQHGIWVRPDDPNGCLQISEGDAVITK
jgi:hypothetical protein